MSEFSYELYINDTDQLTCQALYFDCEYQARDIADKLRFFLDSKYHISLDRIEHSGDCRIHKEWEF
jgi:hypothetical protein